MLNAYIKKHAASKNTSIPELKTVFSPTLMDQLVPRRIDPYSLQLKYKQRYEYLKHLTYDQKQLLMYILIALKKSKPENNIDHISHLRKIHNKIIKLKYIFVGDRKDISAPEKIILLTITKYLDKTSNIEDYDVIDKLEIEQEALLKILVTLIPIKQLLNETLDNSLTISKH